MTKARDLADYTGLQADLAGLQTNITAGDTAARAGRKNLLLNGSMQIAQRGTSSAGLGASNGYFTLDRWKIQQGNSAGRFTMTQDSDGPAGFANSLKLDCTTADTSIAVGEQSYLIYKFEGQDLQHLKKGTSGAESMTLSFYVKGNAAATYTAEFYDADNNRHNGQTFSVTTSWNKVTLTYVPDTTGAYNDDNALSLYLFIWIHAGSEFTSGTFTSNTWLSNDATRRIADQTSFYDSTSRTLNITGVQLEVGAVATNFEHRSYGEELALCERYFYLLNLDAVNAFYSAYLTRWMTEHVTFPVTMRATPSYSVKSGQVRYQYWQYGYESDSLTAINTAELNNQRVMFIFTATGSYSPANHGMHNNTNNMLVNMDAEL